MRRFAHILLVCLVFAFGGAVGVPSASAQQRVEAVGASMPTATGEAGHIALNAGSSDVVFSIYSITGQQVKVIRIAAGGQASVELPRGFYIVKCSNLWSRKVVVR